MLSKLTGWDHNSHNCVLFTGVLKILNREVGMALSYFQPRKTRRMNLLVRSAVYHLISEDKGKKVQCADAPKQWAASQRALGCMKSRCLVAPQMRQGRQGTWKESSGRDVFRQRGMSSRENRGPGKPH